MAYVGVRKAKIKKKSLAQRTLPGSQGETKFEQYS